MPRNNRHTIEETFVPIPTADEVSPLEVLGRHEKELAWQGKILNWTFGFVIAVMIVCVIGFLTFLFNELNNNASAYKDYAATLREIRRDEIINLEKRVEKLENLQATNSSISSQK